MNDQEWVDLDALSSLQLVRLMNGEDAKLAAVVASQAQGIADGIDAIAQRLARGGRLFYLGAGTSGRLGVLDAVECPPTFSTDPQMVQGLIAGGSKALTDAVEGAEDDGALAEQDLQGVRLSADDVLVGIAASGSTPYVLAGLQFAKAKGSFTMGLACCAKPAMENFCQLCICLPVGPEVISGSTRLKAGTATKMVLNMLSTGAMVRLGKTYGSLMVDVKASNKKLRQRASRLVQRLTELDEDAAVALLQGCDWQVKTAVVAARLGLQPRQARDRLAAKGARLSLLLVKDGRTR